MRDRAVEALAAMGAPAAEVRPAIVDHLFSLLGDADSDVRGGAVAALGTDAVKALGAIGAAAARPEIVDRLFSLLSVASRGFAGAPPERWRKSAPLQRPRPVRRS
jgi:HEAT repeat protein